MWKEYSISSWCYTDTFCGYRSSGADHMDWPVHQTCLNNPFGYWSKPDQYIRFSLQNSWRLWMFISSKYGISECSPPPNIVFQSKGFDSSPLLTTIQQTFQCWWSYMILHQQYTGPHSFLGGAFHLVQGEAAINEIAKLTHITWSTRLD